jgi:hypothetical protein
VSYIDSQYKDQSRDGDVEFDFVSRDNIQKTGRFDLNNHARQQGIAWGLDYIYAHVEYPDLDPWDYQQAAANLGYWFSEVFRLFVSGGIESSYEDIFDPSMDDNFWEAGFQYKPNQHLDVELAVGERSFGNSVRGNVSLEFRRGRTMLSYSESPSSRGQLGSDYRPLVSSDTLNGYLDRPGDTDIFVLRSGEWQTYIELAKTDISLRVFAEAHDQRISPTGEALSDEEFYGAAFRLAWRLGAKSTLGFDLDRVFRKIDDEPISQESDFSRVGIDFTYRLSKRLRLIAAAMHSKENSLGLSALNYNENQLRLTLRTEF